MNLAEPRSFRRSYATSKFCVVAYSRVMLSMDGVSGALVPLFFRLCQPEGSPGLVLI